MDKEGKLGVLIGALLGLFILTVILVPSCLLTTQVHLYSIEVPKETSRTLLYSEALNSKVIKSIEEVNPQIGDNYIFLLIEERGINKTRKVDLVLNSTGLKFQHLANLGNLPIPFFPKED